MAMTGAPPKSGYRYVTSFIDAAGKRRYRFQRRGYKSVYMPDVKEPGFETAYIKALSEMDTKRTPHRLSFDAAIDRYLNSQPFRAKKATTQKSDRRRLINLAREYGQHSIRDLTALKLSRLLDKIESPSERNRTLTMFRVVLKESKKQEVILTNPADKVERVKHVTKSYAVWTREEIDSFLQHHAAGTTPHLAMQLLYRTGQRSSDVVQMGSHTLLGGRIQLEQDKTGSVVDIPLSDELKKVLPTHNHKTWLVTYKKEPFSAKGFQQGFVKWAKAAGVHGKSSHGVRAAVATHAAENGATTQEIMAVTGHKSLAEVERYTRSANRAGMADKLFQKGKESNGL